MSRSLMMECVVQYKSKYQCSFTDCLPWVFFSGPVISQKLKVQNG